MKEINLFQEVGIFAENKDVARKIRIKNIMPCLKKGEELIINFEGVESATQSFIHALISEVIRKFGNDVLDKISFKKCNDNVRRIINIVVDYMQT